MSLTHSINFILWNSTAYSFVFIVRCLIITAGIYKKSVGSPKSLIYYYHCSCSLHFKECMSLNEYCILKLLKLIFVIVMDKNESCSILTLIVAL